MVINLDGDKSEKWWENNKEWIPSTKELESLPEMRTNISATTKVKSRAASAQNRFKQGEKFVLNARSAIMFDMDEPSPLYRLSSILSKLDHPLLIISRIPPKSLEEEYGIPEENCKWLTESIGNENTLGPALEPIIRMVEEFINVNERAVIMLDGIEFLASVNGFVRVLDFIRDIVDYITEDDDLLLIPTDMQAWTQQEQTNILRELEFIENKTLQYWLENSQEIEEHPFHLPDFIKEELLDKKIKNIISEASKKGVTKENYQEIKTTNITNTDNSKNKLYLGEIAQEWAEEVISEAEQKIEPTTNKLIIEDDTIENWTPTFVTPNQVETKMEEPKTNVVPPISRTYTTKGPKRPNLIKKRKMSLPKAATEDDFLTKKSQWEEAASKSVELSGEINSDKESKRLIRQTGLANMSENNKIPESNEDSDPIEHIIKKMSWDAAAENAKKRGKNVK